jgi:hypothetical protein
MGRPDSRRGTPPGAGRPRRRLPASRRCPAGPRQTWPHRPPYPPRSTPRDRGSRCRRTSDTLEPAQSCQAPGRPIRSRLVLCRLPSGGMRGIGRRLAVAGVLAVVLAAVLVQGSETSRGGWVDSEQRAAAVVVGAAPSGALSLVTRARTAVDGELVSLSRFSKAALVGAALGLGLPAPAWGWWYLMRPDRRFASPSRRASLAALRAPPRLVVP